jgi:hypothetical protein
VLQGPGENAGAIDIGDGWAVVFKIESHNHPSFIEPFQGAATGVGGILNANGVFTVRVLPELISWWRGEFNVLDEQGVNPGIPSDGINFTESGVFGSAFSFDDSEAVEVPASTTLQPAQVTAVAWVRHLYSPGSQTFVLSQGASGCTAPSYAIQTGSGGILFSIYNGASVILSPEKDSSIWDSMTRWVVLHATHGVTVA